MQHCQEPGGGKEDLDNQIEHHQAPPQKKGGDKKWLRNWQERGTTERREVSKLCGVTQVLQFGAGIMVSTLARLAATAADQGEMEIYENLMEIIRLWEEMC